MSLQTRDLRCGRCGTVRWNVASEFRKYPPCAKCGGKTHVTWEAGQPPATDVFGCATYSDATGEYHTSQRDKIRVMKEHGYEEAGDPVGGARNDHTLKNTAISAPGLGLRRSTGER
jgi:hypothetical protein